MVGMGRGKEETARNSPVAEFIDPVRELKPVLNGVKVGLKGV
jgi:hypothetical protein